MNSTTFPRHEVFGLGVPAFLPSDTSSTVGFIASTLFLAFVVTILYDTVIYPSLSTKGRFWKQQTWLSEQGGWFSGLKGQLRSLRESRLMVNEGYKKYSKNGKTFMVPRFGNEPFLVLPPTELHTLLGKPDNELDEQIPHQEATMMKYTSGNPRLMANNFHFDVVRRELTRKLPLLTPHVHEELCLGMSSLWSSSSAAWNTIKIYPTAMRIVSRAANRVFAGTELCRNEEFLEHSKRYSQGVFGAGMLINIVPSWLRFIAGPLIAYPNRKNFAICHRHAEPVIRGRLDNTIRKLQEPNYDWEVPTDALQWLIELVLERGDKEELSTTQICRRLLGLNMVAIHTTSIVMSNVIMDLYSAPDSKDLVAGLRDECERVLAANDGVWTKQAINDLIRVDSAIRETMRFSDLGNLGLHRIVVADKGVDFHGGDIHVPKGVRVVIPTHSIHHDDDFYNGAMRYDPFRFSAPREAHAKEADKDMQKTLSLKNQALITIGDQFMSFGNGRHACPGRFFAAQEMKLMLAETVLNYEIEIVGEKGVRPRNIDLVNSSIPDGKVEMRVRRRS